MPMSEPHTWELTAYGRLLHEDGHYARRRSDDQVMRHCDFATAEQFAAFMETGELTPCGCPNQAEYGPVLPSGVHNITIDVTVRVQMRNGNGDGILYEDVFTMPWDCNPMDVTWRADARVIDGSRKLFEKEKT
jgi:hypothetical protein